MIKFLKTSNSDWINVSNIRSISVNGAGEVTAYMMDGYQYLLFAAPTFEQASLQLDSFIITIGLNFEVVR